MTSRFLAWRADDQPCYKYRYSQPYDQQLGLYLSEACEKSVKTDYPSYDARYAEEHAEGK